MTSEQLSAYAGILLSLIFSYAPGLRQKFELFSSDQKRLIVTASLVITATLIFALDCLDAINVIACDRKGAFSLIGNIIAALIASQATYMITPKNGFSQLIRRQKNAPQVQITSEEG